MNNQLTPPYSIEAEQGAIASILQFGKTEQAVREMMDTISADMIYNATNRELYAFLENQESPSYITLMDDVRNNNLGGIQIDIGYIADLKKSYVSKNQIPQYSAIIGERFNQRELIRIADNIMQQAYAKVPSTEIQETLTSVLAGIESPSAYIPKHLAEYASEWMDVMEKRTQSDPSVIGVKTGLTELDNQIVGIGNTWLCVLAGRPSHGKSLVAQLIGNYISYNRPIMFFSMEMTEQEIMDRTMGLVADIAPNSIRQGDLTDTEWHKAGEVVKALKTNAMKFYIDTTPSLSIHQICARVKAFKRRYPNAGLIQIDYLGLMEKPKSDRNDLAIAEITRKLKQLAKEIEIPILLLVQCNRAADTAKRLTMSNLADAASIERDADLVLFTHREEVSDPDTHKKGIIEITGGKFRHGTLDRDVLIERSEAGFRCLSIDEQIELKNKEQTNSKSSFKSKFGSAA